MPGPNLGLPRLGRAKHGLSGHPQPRSRPLAPRAGPRPAASLGWVCSPSWASPRLLAPAGRAPQLGHLASVGRGRPLVPSPRCLAALHASAGRHDARERFLPAILGSASVGRGVPTSVGWPGWLCKARISSALMGWRGLLLAPSEALAGFQLGSEQYLGAARRRTASVVRGNLPPGQGEARRC